MSSIKVTDKRGGLYSAAISFTYGECERLPFNILRRAGAKITPVANGGVVAQVEYNVRDPKGSALFLEMLDLFGEDGSFVHGSPADPKALALASPAHPGHGEVQVASPSQEDDGLEIEEPEGGK